MTRRVVVWRHGETEHNAGGIYQGQLDSHLSARGRRQARQAAAMLADRGVDLLVSSDLVRAADTAAALTAATGLPARPDPRWREIHVGSWQGLRHPDVADAFPEVVAAVEQGEDPVRGGHGERVADVRIRVRAAFDDLVAGLPDGATAVVATHGVATRALVGDVLGLDPRVAWLALVGLRNGHWAELVEHRTGWRLDGWNIGALPGPDDPPAG